MSSLAREILRRSHSSSYIRISSPGGVKNRSTSYLNPKSSPLADCGQLRRLEVGESKRGKVTVLLRELGEPIDNDSEFLEEKCQSLPNENEIGVATREGVRRTR